MGERLVLVCDVCGVPAQETVSFSVGGRNLQKDLCAEHLAELTAGSRAPRRGRRPRSATSGGGTRESTARRARPARKVLAKSSHHGRPRKQAEKASAEAPSKAT
jgi:hypothetical protein